MIWWRRTDLFTRFRLDACPCSRTGRAVHGNQKAHLLGLTVPWPLAV
jgi:hypothetical protein